MSTLFQLTYEVARELGGAFQHGQATGGSTSTLIDTVDLLQADNFWNRGTVWVLSGNAANQYARVTAFVKATSTATISPLLTQAIANGNRYAIGNIRYSLRDIIGKINQAIQEIGLVWLTDKSITTSGSDTEYDLPANIRDLRRVWEQRRTGNPNDNQWEKRIDFDVERNASSADRLIFMTPPFGNRLLKLDHLGIHPALDVATDVLQETVPPRRVVLSAAIHLLEGKQHDPTQADPTLAPTLQRLREERLVLEGEQIIDRPPRQTKMLALRRAEIRRYPGDRNPR